MAPRTIEQQRAARTASPREARQPRSRRAKAVGLGSVGSLVSTLLSFTSVGDLRIRALQTAVRWVTELEVFS